MKIDVIVPCYNAHKTLPRLLGSIISQVIAEDIEVTLVNDCSEKGYDEIIKQFNPFIAIREIKMKKNGGPGAARRYGYENTKNPLVTWIDADDTFAGAFALRTLRTELLAEPQNAMCFGTFIEEHDEAQPKPVYLAHAQDTVWMFGKLYKREFLDMHEIKMNDTRANEDNGFNMLCKLLCDENHTIKFIPDTVYYWHSNANSITRINNCQYAYDQSFCGYTDNMIWAFKEAEKRNPFNGKILFEKTASMVHLYEYYIETEVRDKRFIEQNRQYCLKYYKEIYREIKDKIPEKAFTEIYNGVIRNAYAGDKLNGIIPSMGIYEFLNKMEQECAKGEETCKNTQNLTKSAV